MKKKKVTCNALALAIKSQAHLLETPMKIFVSNGAKAMQSSVFWQSPVDLMAGTSAVLQAQFLGNAKTTRLASNHAQKL